MKKILVFSVIILGIAGTVWIIVGVGRTTPDDRRNNASPTNSYQEKKLSDLLASRLPVEGVEVKGPELQRLQEIYRHYKSGDHLKLSDALEVAKLFDEDGADSDQGSGIVIDLDGSGSPDLAIKRYWTGTGSGFDLHIFLKVQEKYTHYEFNGGERGISCFGETDYASNGLPVDKHLEDLDKDGIMEIIIPECLRYRGAGTSSNWPEIYTLNKKEEYGVADERFPEFYKERLLPRLMKLQIEDDDVEGKRDRDEMIDLISKLVKNGERK